MFNSISMIPIAEDEVTSSDEAMSWDPMTLDDNAAGTNSARSLLLQATSFITELKRRKVYKVVVAYAVVAWLVIQAASIFLPAFDAPPCMMKAVVVFLALGFIPSSILSWVFDITPQGIKRTRDSSANLPVDIIRQLQAQARQEFVRGYLSALIYAGLGDKTQAIDFLKREYLSYGKSNPAGTRVDAILDSLRGDPLFKSAAQRPQ